MRACASTYLSTERKDRKEDVDSDTRHGNSRESSNFIMHLGQPQRIPTCTVSSRRAGVLHDQSIPASRLSFEDCADWRNISEVYGLDPAKDPVEDHLDYCLNVPEQLRLRRLGLDAVDASDRYSSCLS